MRRVADGILAVTILVVVLVPLPYLLQGDLAQYARDWNLTITAAALLTVLPAMLARRQPSNALLVVLLVTGANATLQLLGNAAIEVALGSPRPVADTLVIAGLGPLALVGTWLAFAFWVPTPALLVTSVLLRFPDGCLQSRRARAFEWLAWAGIIVTVVGHTVQMAAAGTTVGDLTVDPSPVVSLGLAMVGLAAIGSVGSVVGRARSADGVGRHQLRWAAFGLGAFALAAVVSLGIDVGGGFDAAGQPTMLFQYTSFPALLVLEACLLVAILRYRLYDIDVVLNRTFVFGALAAFITAVYVAIVVGVGTLVGDTSSLSLSIGATTIVAVAFDPIRRRVQHAANLLVYGERATPYEVLAGMTDATAHPDPSEVVAQAAALLGEGTGAASVVVWSRVDRQLVPTWEWPAGETLRSPVPIDAAEAHDLGAADLARRLVRDAEVVGAVTVTKQRGEPVRSTDVRLVDEFAGQAAVLVANAQLTAQLRRRLAELASSRRRLVSAQDEARRRLERDVHDGAQQHLVALKVRLGLARTLAEHEHAGQVAAMMTTLAGDADATVAALRDLARGIHSPLLETEGLGPALRARVRQVPLPVTVEEVEVGRHAAEVELAVWYCVLEALQNAAKHAGATEARVVLDGRDGLRATVADDGVGFDVDLASGGTGLQGMRDRLDVIGGGVTVTSRPGAGTTIVAHVPARVAQPDRPDHAPASTSGVNSDFDTKPTAPAANAPVS